MLALSALVPALCLKHLHNLYPPGEVPPQVAGVTVQTVPPGGAFLISPGESWPLPR